MQRVTPQWKFLLLMTVVALVGILVLKPDYVALQTADDADAFRRVLGDDQTRAFLAGWCDIVFTFGYGLLGVIGFRALATGRLALAGVLLTVGAAVTDQVENAFVLLNVSRADSTTDAWINAMTAVGVVKIVLFVAALVLLLGLTGRHMMSRRG